MPDGIAAVVVDNGSVLCKAGFAGDDLPRVVIPNIVGRIKPQYTKLFNDRIDGFIGDEAQKKRACLALKYPIERGTVIDWDDMEKVWLYLLTDELKISTEESTVLLTEPPYSPKNNREIMAQIMFEKFGVPAMYVAPTGLLSLTASGRVTGFVADIGGGVFSTASYRHGRFFPVVHFSRTNMGGKDLTDYLAKMLTERGHYMNSTSAERDLVRDMMEKLCYVALDFKQEMARESSSTEKSYQMPDGEMINIGNERFRVPEMLFKPAILDLEDPGVPETIFQNIMKISLDDRDALFNNIVLSGGSSMFPGFADRLRRDLRNLVPPNKNVNVISAPMRKYSVWIGGSITASLNNFQQEFITKQQFDEHGVRILHHKDYAL